MPPPSLGLLGPFASLAGDPSSDEKLTWKKFLIYLNSRRSLKVQNAENGYSCFAELNKNAKSFWRKPYKSFKIDRKSKQTKYQEKLELKKIQI
jgi:hypothetical protein